MLELLSTECRVNDFWSMWQGLFKVTPFEVLSWRTKPWIGLSWKCFHSVHVPGNSLFLRAQQALESVLAWRSHVGTRWSRGKEVGERSFGLSSLVTETPPDSGPLCLPATEKIGLGLKSWVNKHCHLLLEPRTVPEHSVSVNEHLMNE